MQTNRQEERMTKKTIQWNKNDTNWRWWRKIMHGRYTRSQNVYNRMKKNEFYFVILLFFFFRISTPLNQ